MSSFVIIRRGGDLAEQDIAHWCISVEQKINAEEVTLIDKPTAGREEVVDGLKKAGYSAALLYYGHGKKGNLITDKGETLLSANDDSNLLRSRFCYLVACYGATLGADDRRPGCVIGYSDEYIFCRSGVKEGGGEGAQSYRGFEEGANAAFLAMLLDNSSAEEAVEKGKQVYRQWADKYMKREGLKSAEFFLATHIASLLRKNARFLCCKGNRSFRLSSNHT